MKVETEDQILLGVKVKSKDLLVKENSINETEVDVHATNLKQRDLENNQNKTNMKSKLEIKSEISHDLTPKPKLKISGIDSHLNTSVKMEIEEHSKNVLKMDNNSMQIDKNYSKDTNCELKVETRLENIPKDILGKYGIVFEDCDEWRDNQKMEIEKNLSEEEENNLSEDEEKNYDNDPDEGKLIIDEGEPENNNDKCLQENPTLEVKSFKVESKNSNRKEKVLKNSSQAVNYEDEMIASSINPLSKSVHCHICYELLSDTKSVLYHKNHHCRFQGCQDLIENETARKKHQEVHDSNPMKPFRCELCKKRFHFYRYSKKHRENCKRLKKSKCPFCNYSFSNITLFNKHIVKHTNKFYCSDCNKSFLHLATYRRHLYAQHRKEILFKCTECPRHFLLQEGILSHVKTHNLNVSEGGIMRFIEAQTIGN